MSLSTIVAFLRNGLCCIKDLNLFSSTALYDPSYTALVYALPPPHLSKTTPLDLLIGILQFYAFVTLIWEGIQSMKRGMELKRRVQRALSKLPLQQSVKYATAIRIVKQKMLGDAASADRATVQGFWVACIGVSFFWLFMNSFHVTATNIIGGVQGLIHALTLALIALLVLLYYMLVDAWAKVKKSRYLKSVVIPKLESSCGRLGVVTTEDFFDANTFAWINSNGWEPYWTMKDDAGSGSDSTLLQQEQQRIQLTIDTLMARPGEEDRKSSSLPQAVAMTCQRLQREAWFLTMSGLLEYLLFSLNVCAFYGYLICVLCFYLADGEDAPAYWKQMKFFSENSFADWSGNFFGDVMWTIEPFMLIVAPRLLVSMAPTVSIASKSNKFKSD